MLSLPPSAELAKACTGSDPAVDRLREIVLAQQRFAGGGDPVVLENRLHLLRRRTLHPKLHVAPVFGIVGVAVPRIGDADAAVERYLSIDDQQFAMRAIVDPVQAVPVQRMKEGKLHAALAQRIDRGLLHARRSGPVSQHAHFHARLCTLGQCRDELVGNTARPVDVRFQIDAVPCRTDRRQHRGKNLCAVLVVVDAVALDDGRAKQGACLTTKLRAAHGADVADALLQLLFLRPEVEHHDTEHGGGQHADDDPGDAPAPRFPRCHPSLSCRGPVT